VTVTVPAEMPVTTVAPAPEGVRETLPLLLVHAPPVAAFVRVIVVPVHTSLDPDIVAGSGLTVRVAVALQLVGNVYVIMDVPAAAPVTSPLVLPIGPTMLFPDSQVPPAGLLNKVALIP
jgi:hypothetical protein